MIEKGLVLDVRNGRARIEIEHRGGSCCAGCAFCTVDGTGGTLELDAPPELRTGDTVALKVPIRSALVGALVMLAVPLVLLVGGVLVGATLFSAADGGESVNAPALILGAALMLIWYFGVWLVEKKRGKTPAEPPQIVGITRRRR